MKSRIEKILGDKHLSPAKFADEIGVQRSGVSHILSGRNKPSLDFIRKILIRFSDINPEWLIMGRGDMYISRSNYNEKEKKEEKYDILDIEKDNDLIEIKEKQDKKVEKVVIFYSDNTFQEFYSQEL